MTGSRTDGSRKTNKAHRLSWEINRGPVPPELCVLHKCDHPPCVNPDHLFIGTIADNNDDKIRKRRHNNPRGEFARHSRLTEDQVKQIKLALSRQEPAREIARRFGVRHFAIQKIRDGKNWAHVT